MNIINYFIIIIAMTSIDLYDQLVKDIDADDLPRTESRYSKREIQDQFEKILMECNKLVSSIKQNNGDIIRFKDRLATNSLPQRQAAICENINKKCEVNFQMISQLRLNLMAVTQIVEQAKKELPDQPETFSKVYRKQHLAQEIDKILVEAFTIQKLVQKFSFDTTRKRIKFILPQATNEQVNNLAKQSNGLRQVVMSKLTGKASLKLKYARKDILQKTEGMARLEQSVEANLKLIREIAIMVQQQGQMIDSILVNVTNAKDYTQKANLNLVKEKNKHKSSKKKVCCIIFVSIVLLALVLVPIILKIVNSKKAAVTDGPVANNGPETPEQLVYRKLTSSFSHLGY